MRFIEYALVWIFIFSYFHFDNRIIFDNIIWANLNGKKTFYYDGDNIFSCYFAIKFDSIGLDCMQYAWTLDAQFRVRMNARIFNSKLNSLAGLNVRIIDQCIGTISIPYIRFDSIVSQMHKTLTKPNCRLKSMDKHSATGASQSTTFDGKWSEDAYFCLVLCVYHTRILLRKESNWVKEHVQLCTL